MGRASAASGWLVIFMSGVPVVFGVAVLTFLIWYFFVPEPVFSRALLNFVSVLIIACPCAMGLATPTAVDVHENGRFH